MTVKNISVIILCLAFSLFAYSQDSIEIDYTGLLPFNIPDFITQRQPTKMSPPNIGAAAAYIKENLSITVSIHGNNTEQEEYLQGLLNKVDSYDNISKKNVLGWSAVSCYKKDWELRQIAGGKVDYYMLSFFEGFRQETIRMDHFLVRGSVKLAQIILGR